MPRNTCQNCKFWYRGKKITYSDQSKTFNGESHPKAGSTEIVRDWPDQNLGECIATKAVPRAIPSYTTPNSVPFATPKAGGALLTNRAYFCSYFTAGNDGDRYEYVYIDYRGQKLLADFKREMAEDDGLALPGPIAVRSDGWVKFPDPELEVVLRPKHLPGAELGSEEESLLEYKP